jgi:phytoene dehydrogenase-like protein
MKKKVIIIGAGVAGLSAGIYGQMNGYDTEIIEMHTLPGGQCTAWSRDGYRFDYCLHWLVGTSKGPFHNIWKETNVLNDSTKIIDHEIHSKIYNEKGEEFIIYSDINKWEQYLLEFSPEDSISIKKMCNEMRKASSLEPFGNPPELRKFSDYLNMIRTMFPTLMMMMKYGKKTCDEYFNKMDFKSEKLKSFFSMYSGRDFSALAFILMLVWFSQKNAGYIIGGSLPMALRMSDKYKSLGGKFTFGKKVTRITVENGKATGVILQDGSNIPADYVISAADGHFTIFEMLERKYLSKEIEDAYNNWKLFEPLVQVSFGINKFIQADCPAKSFLNKNISIGSTKPETGYSIMNYSFDPTMAPEGKTTIVMRYESPWNIWKDLDKEKYDQEKKKIEKDAIEILEKLYPGIKQNIDVIDIATPKTDVEFTGVWKGSYEGFFPSVKNITKSLKMTLPNLTNFYMIGQWLTPGGGLPPSTQSGKWVFQLICKKENQEFKII